MPSAVLLSIAIHAALFFLAGALVVFTVVKKKEVEFEPPKAVERPKMKLKKPKVKVRKTSRPKPTTRIVTRVNRASMPDIQLPEMSGMGEGLGEGIAGGFDMMPDLGDVSVFGSAQTIGNDFEGWFYDFKRDRAGRPISYSAAEYLVIARKFLKSGWKTSVLARYYKSPKKRYATAFMVPPLPSAIVPSIFDEPETEGIFWGVHYKGQLVHRDGITFRFVGVGDGAMAVRVDGEVVLGAGWNNVFEHVWRSSSANHNKYPMGTYWAGVGDWITLEPGVPLAMEVFMVEGGGEGCLMLAVEEKGVEYEKRTVGGPTFPAFKTAELSHDSLDAIYKYLVPGEVNLTNGPVFNDYGTKVSPSTSHLPPPTPVLRSFSEAGSHIPKPALRTWILADGRAIEAEFINIFGEKVVLKNSKGKISKIPKERLSPEDIEYVELSNPPVFDIDFSARSEQVFSIKGGGSSGETMARNYRAKVRLKQKSAGAYKHKLHVEFFAVGKEIAGNRYILLDRQKSHFTPNAENQRSHEFSGRRVRLLDFVSRWAAGRHFGERGYGYLVTVTDLRGKIIGHEESNEWLYENLERLKQLPVGAYMDKNCNRVFPTSPKRTRY
ncbi:MAG: SHD1 domain-containing protein [Verrucomicrobiota bacterium]